MWVINKANGERVKTRVVSITNTELKRIAKNKSKLGFEFDWQEQKENEVYKLELIGASEILGLVSLKTIHEELRIEICLLEVSSNNIGKKKKFENIAGILIAFACRLSFKLGFFGFVSLVPKTKLVNHYKKKYGLVPYGKHLGTDLENSEALINKYLDNEK